MDAHEATQLAQEAVAVVTVGNPEPVADTTVVYKNEDGTFSVCDNGEEAIAEDAETAIRFIVENLTAGHLND